MYLSVFMGPFSRTEEDDHAVIDHCLEQAVAAAEAGFAMVTFGEQHFNNYEPYCNPFMMGARLAPFLKDTWFGTTICPVPLNPAVRLAEQINILDVLMKGRVIVGCSSGRVGWSPDLPNFNVDPEEREEAFHSKIAIMEEAWGRKMGDPIMKINTKWDQGAIHGRLMPLSYRSPRPLLAVGTSTDEKIVEAGARGWPVFLGPCLVPEAQAKFALHREALREAGLDTAAIQHLASYSLVTRHTIVGETDEQAWEMAEQMVGMNPMMDRMNDKRSLRELSQVNISAPGASQDPANRNANWVQSWLICGGPESVLRELRRYDEHGIPHLNTRFTVGMFNPELSWRSFNLFVEEVVPKLDLQLFGDVPPRVLR